MTQEEIRQVVRETIAELRRQGVLQDDIQQAYQISAQRLKMYYSGNTDAKLAEVLDNLRNDVYFDIIVLYYRDGLTLEQLAHKLHIDTSTAKRNKKRLCLEIYSELN